MYVSGVSTRKVKKITEVLCGLEISRTRVSRPAKEPDEQIAIWRSRRLEKEYGYPVVDAHFEKVRKGDRRGVLEILRGITNARNVELAGEALAKAVEELSEGYAQVAATLEQEGEDILTVYELPEGHRKRMRSTNMVERLNREFRRRSRVVRIFPDEASCVRLTSAPAMEFNEEWMERRYLDMEADELSGADEAREREAA